MPLSLTVTLPDSCSEKLLHICAERQIIPQAFVEQAALQMLKEPSPVRVRSIGEHLLGEPHVVTIRPRGSAPVAIEPDVPKSTTIKRNDRITWDRDAQALLSLGDNAFVIRELKAMRGIDVSSEQVQGGRNRFRFLVKNLKVPAPSSS